MKFHNPGASLYLTDLLPKEEIFNKVTHLGVGAHQDDLEFMAFHGILECFDSDELWFAGVTCTNGHGSSRTGPHAGRSDDEIGKLRAQEQITAAIIGRYAFMAQLDYPSAVVNSPTNTLLADDLFEILRESQPRVIYTHNPADKHDTHIAVLVSLLQAIHRLPPRNRPQRLIGCEVWRSLDWLQDDEKIAMDVSGRDHLANALNGVFDSQIAGGKRFDLATIGRRRANATFFEPRAGDTATDIIFGMDLSPLLASPMPDLVTFTTDAIRRFENDVIARINRHLPSRVGVTPH